MKLVIGNKNYSSWSLRPWILMKHAGFQFSEVHIPLFGDKMEALMEKWSPSRQVPVLHDGPLVLWDSLAICEYIADKDENVSLWPEDSVERARARAMSAEMHSGFESLRNTMPMNCRRIVEGFEPDLETQIDINRIVQLFEDALQMSGGPWLFGDYSVADAMYAPVVTRFNTYKTSLPSESARYAKRVLDDLHMQAWFAAAANEKQTIEKSEVPDKVSGAETV